MIPHGIFDLQKNLGFITIGSSSETAAFIVDNLRWWWFNFGINDYPDARNLLLLCDAGGGNSYRHHVFKKELQTFAKEIGIDIIVAHYPPYASKWNPIEHRLFCHVHQTMSGQMFKDYEFVKTLIDKTSTKQGLKVTVRINLKDYQTGIKTDKNQVDEKKNSTTPNYTRTKLQNCSLNSAFIYFSFLRQNHSRIDSQISRLFARCNDRSYLYV